MFTVEVKVAQLVKYRLECRRLRFNFWVRKNPWRRDRLPTPVFLGFPGGSDGKESARNAGDLGLIPGLGRSPGGEHGNALQYSCLGNPTGTRSLAGYSPWGRKELDTTDQLSIKNSHFLGPLLGRGPLIERMKSVSKLIGKRCLSPNRNKMESKWAVGSGSCLHFSMQVSTCGWEFPGKGCEDSTSR